LAAFFGAAFLVAFFAGAFLVAIVFPFPIDLGFGGFPPDCRRCKKRYFYNTVKDLPFIVLFGCFLRNFTTK
jgi:hypothetical protein